MLPLPLHRFGTPGARRGLWLHGFLGSGAEGGALFRAWPEGGEVLCPDLPGHGERPVRDFDLSSTLAAIAGLAEGCSWAGGYSMGGRLLMMAAARHPEAFSSLIVESASLGLATPEERASRRQVDGERADRLRRDGLEAFAAWWYAQPMWRGFAPPQRTGDAEAMSRALEVFSVANQPDLRSWVIRTTCPLLWLAGERDSGYVASARWVQRHAPRATVRIFPGAGHNLHLEHPDGWRAAARDFFTQRNQQEQ